MIRADQLQIGDFVLVDGKPRRVEAITKKKIGYHHNPQTDKRLYYARLSDVKPIKITEEMLSDMGFTKTEKKADANTCVLDGWYLIGNLLPFETLERSYYIAVHLWDAGTLIKVDAYHDGYVRKVHLPKVPYLHQLQQACRMCGIKIDWKL